MNRVTRPPRSRIPGSLYGRSSVFRGGRGAGLMAPPEIASAPPESPLFPGKAPSQPMGKAMAGAPNPPAQISPDPSMPVGTAAKPTQVTTQTPGLAKPIYSQPTDTSQYNPGTTATIPTMPGIGGASPQQRPFADMASVDRRNSGLWPRQPR